LNTTDLDHYLLKIKVKEKQSVRLGIKQKSKYCDVQPNNENLRSELLWLRENLGVMTNNANTLLWQCYSTIQIHLLTFPWLRSGYLVSVESVRGDRQREKVLLDETAVKHVRQ
jgi:hypothetical protein